MNTFDSRMGFNRFRVHNGRANIEIARAMADDPNEPTTLSERHALADCDGHFDADFGPERDQRVNVYYWITRDGGRLVKPVIEMESYDATTGEPYEWLTDDDEERAELWALDDWRDQTIGLAEYYMDI